MKLGMIMIRTLGDPPLYQYEISEVGVALVQRHAGSSYFGCLKKT